MGFSFCRPPEQQVREYFGTQYRSMANQISVITNMIIAILVTFGIAFFIAGRYFNQTSQVCFRALLF